MNTSQYYENRIIVSENENLSVLTEKEKNKIFDDLRKIYRLVFKKYRVGNLPIYNPDIFSELTEEGFIYWVSKNNPDMAHILDQ